MTMSKNRIKNIILYLKRKWKSKNNLILKRIKLVNFKE